MWNPERLFEQLGLNMIVWDTITTGNYMGFDLWCDEDNRGELSIATNRGDLTLPSDSIGPGGHVSTRAGCPPIAPVPSAYPRIALSAITVARTIDIADAGDTLGSGSASPPRTAIKPDLAPYLFH
ncbi:MAG: hypothetical protein R3D67_15165 [Hyphomicrobiaceae bacterium]